jgi:hypothetical protein
MAAGGTIITGIPSSTIPGAEDGGVGVGLRVGLGGGEGETAGGAEAGRTVVRGDADGGGLTVVLVQAATSTVIAETTRNRRAVPKEGREMGRVSGTSTAVDGWSGTENTISSPNDEDYERER